MNDKKQRQVTERLLADHHRSRAQTAEYRAGRAESHEDRASLLQEAEEAHALADSHEKAAESARGDDDVTSDLAEGHAPELTAESLIERFGPPLELSKERERAVRDRAWYLPGTVADDKMQQLEESQNQGAGLLGQATKYAARSVLDTIEHGIDPQSIAGRVGAAFAEGLTPIGVKDQILRHAEKAADVTTNVKSTADQLAVEKTAELIEKFGGKQSERESNQRKPERDR